MSLEKIKEQLAASDKAGWDWGDHTYLATQIDALIAVVEAAVKVNEGISVYASSALPELRRLRSALDALKAG